MDESKNLLAALQTMMKFKQTAAVESTASLESVPSTSSARKRTHVVDETSPAKKRRVEHSVQKSVGNTFATIPIQVSENMDMHEFLSGAKDEIRMKISEELDERNALKFYIIVKAQLSRTNSDGDEQIATPYFCSVPKIILQSTDIADEIDNAGERIKELLATHEGHGSGVQTGYHIGVPTASCDVRPDRWFQLYSTTEIYPEQESDRQCQERFGRKLFSV